MCDKDQLVNKHMLYLIVTFIAMGEWSYLCMCLTSCRRSTPFCVEYPSVENLDIFYVLEINIVLLKEMQNASFIMMKKVLCLV